MALLRRGQRLQAETTAQNQKLLIEHLDSAQRTSRSQQETTIARLDDLRRGQVAESSAILTASGRTDAHIKSGFLDLSRQISSLTLTDTDDIQVIAEGTDLGAGIEALRSVNQRLSVALQAVARSKIGVKLPHDAANYLTREVDKLIKYSCRSVASGRHGVSADGLDYTLSGRIHTVPVRSSTGIIDTDGFMVIETAEGENVLGQRVRRFRFASFSVKRSGYGSAIVALANDCVGVRPSISRQIRVLNVRPADSRIFFYAAYDLQGFKRLFQAGDASVLDFDENGRSLLWVRYARKTFIIKTCSPESVDIVCPHIFE